MATNERQFPAGTYWINNTLGSVASIRVDNIWVNVPANTGFSCVVKLSIFYVGIPSLEVYRIADDSIFKT